MAHAPFVWQEHEYVFQEKTNDWYWAVGIIAISITVISMIFGNTLFALLILFGIITLTIFASKPPRLIKFEINKSGIIIERSFFPYATLDTFWVEDNTHVDRPSKLFIKSNKVFAPMIAIPLGTMDPQDVRDFLMNHILEEHHIETLSEKALEYLGF